MNMGLLGVTPYKIFFDWFFPIILGAEVYGKHGKTRTRILKSKMATLESVSFFEGLVFCWFQNLAM